MNGHDVWWPFNDPGLVEEVIEAVATYGLPFLERMHAQGEMEKFLTASNVMKGYPPPIIYLALLKNQRGDRVGACEVLGELRRKARGAWVSRISEIAESLGCA